MAVARVVPPIPNFWQRCQIYFAKPQLAMERIMFGDWAPLPGADISKLVLLFLLATMLRPALASYFLLRAGEAPVAFMTLLQGMIVRIEPFLAATFVSAAAITIVGGLRNFKMPLAWRIDMGCVIAMPTLVSGIVGFIITRFVTVNAAAQISQVTTAAGLAVALLLLLIAIRIIPRRK